METDRRIRISATLQRIVYVVFAAFLALFIIYLAVSCSQKGDVRANTVITDYLYGVEYDDYDFDLCIKEYDKRMHPRLGGCSEVRNGNFIGRNLDWYINTDASAIIKVNAKSGTGFSDTRYASLGVVGCSVPFSNEVASSGKWNERAYTFLPFSTTDGINEKGLYVGVNVTATGETSFDKSTWKPFAWGLGAALTNDKSYKVYSVTYLVRIVLDHASSVADAKELIKSISWYDPFDFPEQGATQSFHWLISDAESSCVVEFLDNKIYFNDAESIIKPSYGTIMTNFNNSLMNPEFTDTPLFQHDGMGYERWDVLAKNYDMATSAEGAANLMSLVWYSNTYTKSMDSEDFFFTEYAVDSISAETLYKRGNEMWADEWFRNQVSDKKKEWDDKSLWHIPSTPLWYTTHTCVYDLAKKELSIKVHEGFDGMDKFHTVSFDTHFNKPYDTKH